MDRSSNRMDSLKNSLWPVAVLLMGVAAYFLIIGPRALYPENVAWLSDGDPAQHYLGWSFFRQSPWGFPIGENPAYGLEISNALLYSDSLPLLAFPMKLFTDWLPPTFQYFGIWLLACFILQAWFATKLISLLSDSRWVQWLGAGLFVMSPPMIGRMAGHLSLSGHFLIIAALYLALKERTRRDPVAWALLLVCGALVHAYILAILLAIWIISLATDILHRDSDPKASLVQAFSILSIVLLVCWQVGYFSVSSSGIATGGYGYYRMNLLSLIDASGWSFILRDIPEGGGDYEGFNYLGLGTLLLIGVALVRGTEQIGDWRKILSRHWLLAFLMLGFSLYPG